MNYDKAMIKFYVDTRRLLHIPVAEIFSELQQAYGDNIPSQSTIYSWCSSSHTVKEMKTRDRPKSVRTEDNIEKIRQFIEASSDKMFDTTPNTLQGPPYVGKNLKYEIEF